MDVSEFVWHRLREWGLSRVYGYPGAGVGGPDVGLEKTIADGFDYVQVRHEEMAAFKASVHAKFTSQVGLCYATSGLGARSLPKPGDARGEQIDINGANLGLRYPMEVNLIGDSAATLRVLLPMLQHKSERTWRQRLEKEITAWWKTLEERATQPASPINPQRVFGELSPRLPDNAIITADSGSVANWYGRDLKMRRGMKASLSGSLASLGTGTPYAVAGKMAFPDRTVIACMGDGAMQMNGLNVMITISKYWRKWSNPHLIVLVLNNQDLNQESTQSIPDFSYHKYAELIGLKGIYVDGPEKIGVAWDEALSADRLVILEARTDPNVPPLPPHITLKDAKNFLTMLPSEPELGSVLKNSAREMLSSILPGKH